MSEIDDRLDRLESLVEQQQATIEDQQATIEDLQNAESSESDGERTGTAMVNRRNALKAGGLLALLGVGVGTSSADAQGQVGTDSDPVKEIHTQDINSESLDADTIDATNPDDSEGATAIRGRATASGTAADTIGVEGVSEADADHNSSPEKIPTGVRGETTGDGVTFGVEGASESPPGRGVVGFATSNSYEYNSSDNAAIGVMGLTDRNGDHEDIIEALGVFGNSIAGSGASYGVIGRCESPEGVGVLGNSVHSDGFAVFANGDSYTNGDQTVTGDQTVDGGIDATTVDVSTDSSNPEATAIHGEVTDEDGENYGVVGTTVSDNEDAAGVLGVADATNGDAIGVLGRSDSPDGYGVYSEDHTRSDGHLEVGDGVVHEQRGEPATGELDDGEVMTYNSDGTDGHSAGDLVYAVNDDGAIKTQSIAEKTEAST